MSASLNDKAVSESPSSRAESQLDALIAKIHGLSQGRLPASLGETPLPSHVKQPAPTNSAPVATRPAQAGSQSAVPGQIAHGPATASNALPLPSAASSPLAVVPGRATESFSRSVAGFEPSRDEVWRPAEPETLAESGATETSIEAILFRYLINIGEVEGRQAADQLKMPFRMVEPILARMKFDGFVGYRSSTATNDYIYVLTDAGRVVARNYQNDCSYFGACPVRLKDYVTSVKLQSVEGQHPKRGDLLKAFSDLLINPKMLDKLGPAINSGRGMFLFGFPGNGKTSIAERITSAFGKYIWLPRAIEIEGDILRVYDPMNHELAMPENGPGLLDVGGFDKRWVRVKRPTLVAGGELTMDMLEVQCNRVTNISEAPLQMKSNCGTLLIDDFGRQKMSVDQLLNRWIIPLEKRYDFLNMASGKKIQVPFDQLVIFSTNLEPRDLVDDAFLRRIPYKIEVIDPPEQDFRKLFEIMCSVTKIPYNAEVVDYLIKSHYLPVNRPFRNCQPRDLLLQVKNYCLYNDLPIELTKEYIDFAVDNYFSVM